MKITHHIDELQRQLVVAAATGEAQTKEIAERLVAAAATENISLNAWFVHAVTTALRPQPIVRKSHRSAYSGWVR